MKRSIALPLIVSVAAFAAITSSASALPPEVFSGTWRDEDLNSPYNQVREYLFTLNPAPKPPLPGWKPNGNYTITWRYSTGSVVPAPGNPLTKTWREHPYKLDTIVVDINGRPTDCGWKLDKTKTPWELHLTPAGSFPIRLKRAIGGTPTTTIPLDYHGKWTEKGSSPPVEYEISRYAGTYRKNGGAPQPCTYTNDGLSGYVDLGTGVGRVYVVDADHLILLTGSGYKELVSVAGKYVGEWEDTGTTVTLKLKTGRAYEITKGSLGSAPKPGTWTYNSGTNQIELDPSGVAERLLITGGDELIHVGTPVVLERKGGAVSGNLVPASLRGPWYATANGDLKRYMFNITDTGTATQYVKKEWDPPTTGDASSWPVTGFETAPPAITSPPAGCTYDPGTKKLTLVGLGVFTIDDSGSTSIKLSPVDPKVGDQWFSSPF